MSDDTQIHVKKAPHHKGRGHAFVFYNLMTRIYSMHSQQALCVKEASVIKENDTHFGCHNLKCSKNIFFYRFTNFFSVSSVVVDISEKLINQATKPLNSHNDTKNRIFTGQSKDRICWNPTWVVDRGGGGLGFVERMEARWTVRSSIFVETREHRERVLEKSPK